MCVKEIVLKAAKALPASFTVSDLVVEAWKLDPKALGLEGHPHPDSRKVATVLYGEKGLIRAGLLKRRRGDKLSVPEAETEIDLPEVSLTDLERRRWHEGNKNTAVLMVMKRLRIASKDASKLLEELTAEEPAAVA